MNKIGKNEEERDVAYVMSSPRIFLKELRKLRKPSILIAGIWTEIQTRDLPERKPLGRCVRYSLKCFRLEHAHGLVSLNVVKYWLACLLRIWEVLS
jgi:hypothetical protein